jgi:hypothetical protein
LQENNEENIKDFSALTKAILTVKCARPFGCNQNGQNEYNDQLQFEMMTLEANCFFLNIKPP